MSIGKKEKQKLESNASSSNPSCHEEGYKIEFTPEEWEKLKNSINITPYQWEQMRNYIDFNMVELKNFIDSDPIIKEMVDSFVRHMDDESNKSSTEPNSYEWEETKELIEANHDKFKHFVDSDPFLKLALEPFLSQSHTHDSNKFK